MLKVFRENVRYNDQAVVSGDLSVWSIFSLILSLFIFSAAYYTFHYYYISIYVIGFIIFFISTSLLNVKKNGIRYELIFLSIFWPGLFLILLFVELGTFLVVLTIKIQELHEKLSSFSFKKKSDIKSEIVENGPYRTVEACHSCHRPL